MTPYPLPRIHKYFTKSTRIPRDRNGLQILTRPECLELLATAQLGRVAVTRYALPAILPVNYALLGEEIVFATGTGSKSLAIASETVIAFEVDAIDPVDKTGWSILAVGTARPFDDRDSDLPAARDLDLHPWVGHFAVNLIRMPTERLSGRRIPTRPDRATSAVPT